MGSTVSSAADFSVKSGLNPLPGVLEFLAPGLDLTLAVSGLLLPRLIFLVGAVFLMPGEACTGLLKAPWLELFIKPFLAVLALG